MNDLWSEAVGPPSDFTYKTRNDNETPASEAFYQDPGHLIGGKNQSVSCNPSGFIGFGFLFSGQLWCISIRRTENPEELLNEPRLTAAQLEDLTLKDYPPSMAKA